MAMSGLGLRAVNGALKGYLQKQAQPDDENHRHQRHQRDHTREVIDDDEEQSDGCPGAERVQEILGIEAQRRQVHGWTR